MEPPPRTLNISHNGVDSPGSCPSHEHSSGPRAYEQIHRRTLGVAISRSGATRSRIRRAIPKKGCTVVGLPFRKSAAATMLSEWAQSACGQAALSRQMRMNYEPLLLAAACGLKHLCQKPSYLSLELLFLVPYVLLRRARNHTYR